MHIISWICVGISVFLSGGESGSADTARDPRGFAVKFYTEDGNWDLVGNNTPIFFIRDPMHFPNFIHTQKRNPVTHLKVPDIGMVFGGWGGKRRGRGKPEGA